MPASGSFLYSSSSLATSGSRSTGESASGPYVPRAMSQGPPHRCLGVEESNFHRQLVRGRRLGLGAKPPQLDEDNLRLSSEGPKPVDDKTAQPGVGAVA